MVEIKWYANDTVAAALEEAREWQKPILVDLWHPTCTGCEKLFIDTYQDESVRAFLTECFVSIKYNTTMPTVWGKRLMASVAHVWHPDLIVLDYRLTELRRIVGYLPPSDFIAQLQVAAGLMDLFHGLAADAYNSFDRVMRDHPESGAAPEAMYWAGVAAYRVGGGLSALAARWESLRARYPSSEWARRADCLDVTIPPEGLSMADPSAIGACPSSTNAR